MSPRRIALVCLTPRPDTDDLGSESMPSFGIRRILAAVVADPALADARVALMDYGCDDVEADLDALQRFEPDLVGFSVYVWSLPTLMAIARRLKTRRPEVCVVFGGPSARLAMFDLLPYARVQAYADAVVSTEGGGGVLRDRAPASAGPRRTAQCARLATAGGWHLAADGTPCTDGEPGRHCQPLPTGLDARRQGGLPGDLPWLPAVVPLLRMGRQRNCAQHLFSRLRGTRTARSPGLGVRAYHCLVLPDALLSRGRPGWDMRFDLASLAMQSCLGWTEAALQAECHHLDRRAAAEGGGIGQFFWTFPPPRPG